MTTKASNAHDFSSTDPFQISISPTVNPTIAGMIFSAGADPGFGQGGPQLLRPKVANVAKQSHASEVSNLWLGSGPT